MLVPSWCNGLVSGSGRRGLGAIFTFVGGVMDNVKIPRNNVKISPSPHIQVAGLKVTIFGGDVKRRCQEVYTHIIALLSGAVTASFPDFVQISRISGRSTTSSAASTSSDSELMSPRAEELIRIQAELRATRTALAEKDRKMNQIQTTVDEEVQELTEKLFQEAYKMVNTAEERREKAEKLLNESRLEVEMLQAEVRALKELISAPGMGKHHFKQTTSPEHKSTLSKLFATSSSSKKVAPLADRKKATSLPSTSSSSSIPTTSEEQKEADAVEEIDPIRFAEFEAWREMGHPERGHVFIDRVVVEEVDPCMRFENSGLAEELMEAIRENRVQLEPLNEMKPSVKRCALTNASRFCPYRVRSGDGEMNEWHDVSLIARNRIAAVCDFFTCIRYLQLGLIKPGPRDSYFHVVNLRKNMSLAKLGLGFVPRSNIRH